jgi:hypothetical protein
VESVFNSFNTRMFPYLLLSIQSYFAILLIN